MNHRIRSQHTLAALCIGLLTFAGTAAHAQSSTYPNRAIRMISPYSPGGNVDLNARYLAKRLTESLGVSVFVENKPGASSIIGTEFLARSAPDGYTIMMVGAGGTTHTVNPALFAKLPYDSVRDFAPVSLFSRVPLVLFVNPKVQAANVHELIAMAKAKPGTLNAASGGDGTASDLAAHLFMAASGTSLTVVRYKGNAPAQADTISGQTQMMFDTFSTVLPQIKAQRVRALAISSAQRSSLMPDLPTVAEAGVPGFEMAVYLGVLAPGGTPREIVSKLAAEIAKVTRDPEAQRQFNQQSIELVNNTPDEFLTFIRADIERWQKITKDAGLKPK